MGFPKPWNLPKIPEGLLGSEENPYWFKLYEAHWRTDLNIYKGMELNTEGKILDSPRTVRRYKMINKCLSAKGVTFILTLETSLSVCGWLRFCAAMKDNEVMISS